MDVDKYSKTGNLISKNFNMFKHNVSVDGNLFVLSSFIGPGIRVGGFTFSEASSRLANFEGVYTLKEPYIKKGLAKIEKEREKFI